MQSTSVASQLATTTTEHSPAVFFEDSTVVAGLGPGDSFILAGAEGRHAAGALRITPGEKVEVVDGMGRRLSCTVETIMEPAQLRLRVTKTQLEPPPQVPITLVQALAKADRDQLAIATATELGIDQVIPWQAERSVVVWRNDRAAKSRAKWESGVVTAAKQSRRARFPEVTAVVNTKQLCATVKHAVALGDVVWVLDANSGQGIAKATLPEAGRALLVVVGPEGGISLAELAALEGAGAQPVRLGPHVLRTSTAGPVAVAIAAERLGRWA
jgi:16S rRNA (uracil1498-N3)-methyltransferase